MRMRSRPFLLGAVAILGNLGTACTAPVGSAPGQPQGSESAPPGAATGAGAPRAGGDGQARTGAPTAGRAATSQAVVDAWKRLQPSRIQGQDPAGGSRASVPSLPVPLPATQVAGLRPGTRANGPYRTEALPGCDGTSTTGGGGPPPEVSMIADAALDYMTWYLGPGKATDTVSLVMKLLDLSGILKSGGGTLSAAALLAQFQQLNQHIDALGVTLSYEQSEKDREDRLSEMTAALSAATDSVRLNQPLDPTTDRVTLGYVGDAEDPIAFQRFFLEAATAGYWKCVIPDRPDHPNGLVYDWRLPVPALMQLIGLRLQVIAALDPNFLWDGVFHDELMGYRTTLISHFMTMILGIRCNVLANSILITDPNHEVDGYWDAACADINTGVNNVQSVTHTGWPIDPYACQTCYGTETGTYCSTDSDCEANRQADYAAWYQDNVQAAQDAALRNVLQMMPLFQMQAMSDALYALANPAPDLTESLGRIPAAGDQGMCLDVINGDPTSGTPVWLYWCTGSVAQQWSYDRKAKTVTNTAFNKCLEVKPISLSILGIPFVFDDTRPQTAAIIDDCISPPPPRQQWSYDPQLGTLRGGDGTVLTIQGGSVQPMNSVLLDFYTGDVTQQWHAD
jgi:Ricin-type beta-trefoil lectin domain